MATPASIHEEETLGKAYDSRLMRRLLAYAWPYRSVVLVALVLLCLQGVLQLVGPFLTQRVIDVALPAHDYTLVRTAAFLYAIALITEFAAQYGETWFTALLGQRVMRDLRMQIFTHLQRLPIPFFDRNPAGRLMTRVTSDVEALNELFTAGVVSGLGDLFTLFAISIAMLVADWRLALAAFAVIPFVALVSFQFRRYVRTAYRDIRTRLARINAFLQERITGIRIVQLFSREKSEAKRFDKLNKAHLDAHLKSITFYALYFPAIEILTSVALASLIVTGAARVHWGTVTIGTVAAFLQLVRRFFQPLQDLSDKYNTLQTAMASSERIFVLLDTEPGVTAAPVSDAGRPQPVSSPSALQAAAPLQGVAEGAPDAQIREELSEESQAIPDAVVGGEVADRVHAMHAVTPVESTVSSALTNSASVNSMGTSAGTPAGTSSELQTSAFITSDLHTAASSSKVELTNGHAATLSHHVPTVEVTFDNVWFAYNDEEWVLKGITFTVKPGETLAIVGHTGAGKTTIVNLLMRFYDPQRGRIMVNGVDIRDMPIHELRSLIGYVQQDIFLFAGDVASNIRLSNPLTDQQVREAAERVGADRIIQRLPNGYHQMLGERGASISVGERQLLSFARAIAADPALLLLDEATSAVDSQIEAEIQYALRVLLAGRTTIAIAHRLSTIVSSNLILVIHHGEVVERGTHQELLALGGLYERLWRLQI